MTGHTDHTRSDITWLGTRLQHLQTLSATLAGARTEQQAIEATLNPGLDVFEADQAVIAMLDESGTVFRIVAVQRLPRPGRSRLGDVPQHATSSRCPMPSAPGSR